MNDFDTLVKEYEPLSEKKSRDFSMEDYFDFAEKSPNKPKLARDWLALALLFKETSKYKESKQSEVYIAETSDMEKELKEIQQKILFMHGISYTLCKESHSFERAKGFYSLFESHFDMEKKKSLEGKMETSTPQASEEELITPWQFLKRMYLITYACLKYPFSKGDVYVDYETGEITHERDLRK